jgi:hypothetical protein
MHRQSSFGFMALIALVITGLAGVGLQAQGRGRGQGRPTTAGRSAPNPHKPPAPQDSADHPSHGQRPTATQLVKQNPHLAARLQTLLPGVDLENASAGFRNLGAFVGAAHVAHNLDIPFDQLKARVTGANPMSLGQAIHELKPGANADAEAKKASRSADDDIKESQGRKPSS